VAIIRVGAPTEAEMKERKSRVEDALHATRAAVEEGVVPGGGVALIRAIAAVRKLKLKDDEAFGAEIVARSLEAPLRQIAANAGADGSMIVEEVKEQSEPTMGYDVLTAKYVDMVKAGIVDPVKVTRMALQNAASIAGLMLTTDTLVTELKEKKAQVEGSVA
jgi:chaperonin GroEL